MYEIDRLILRGSFTAIAHNLLRAINICIRPFFDTNSHTHTHTNSMYCMILAQCRLCGRVFFSLSSLSVFCLAFFFCQWICCNLTYRTSIPWKSCWSREPLICFVFYYLCHSWTFNETVCCFCIFSSLFGLAWRLFVSKLQDFYTNFEPIFYVISIVLHLSANEKS